MKSEKKKKLYFKLGEAPKSWAKRANNKSSKPPYWQVLLNKQYFMPFQEKIPTRVQTIEYYDKETNSFARKKILHYV